MLRAALIVLALTIAGLSPPGGAGASVPNSRAFSQTLTARQLPDVLKTEKPGTATAVHLVYAYDVRRKVSGITDYGHAGNNRSFTYDAAGRLLTASGAWGAGSFKYDALGNLREQKLGARTIAVGYDAAANRAASFRDTALGSNALNTLLYDARGNMIDTGTNSLGRPDMTYDFANQPVTVSGPVTASYSYDGNMKRVKEVRGGKTIYTVYSRLTGGLIYRDQATDAIRTDYVSAGGAALRLKKTGSGAFDPEYSHFDAQGSLVAATNPAGTVRFREQYNPFGEERLNPAANADNPGYTGHLKDDSTGLTYMQARYYDPIIGRFLSTDPIGYQDQLNLYAYVANDPVNNIDPTGMAGCGSRIDGVNNCSGASFFAYERSFIAGAIESYVDTGEHAPGTSKAEQSFIEKDVSGGLDEARDLGSARDAKSFYQNVKSYGKWDFKNRADLRQSGVGVVRLEGAGNWFFGAAGAAWEIGAFGPLSFLSQSTGVGESVLLSGAGIAQMQSDRKLKWQAIQAILGPLPCAICTRGDNPGDQQLISRRYDFYVQNH